MQGSMHWFSSIYTEEEVAIFLLFLFHFLLTVHYYSPKERERVSGKLFPIKDLWMILVSGKLSKFQIYTLSYTHLITSSVSKQLLHRMSLITHYRKKVWLYDKCHKINLSGPFRDNLFYVTLTTSYLRAWTREMSSTPNNSMQLLIKQIRSFSGIQIVYFNCKYALFYIYTRATRMPPWDSPSERKSLRGQLK